ncbi:MAG: hypothetical protein WC859_08040 [Elusimicrobiota bacterium]
MKKPPLLLLLSLGISFVLAGEGWGETKDNNPTDQTDSNYYWQGTQLYNLGRLGEAFESFEKAIQRKQNAKESEAYLLQIRQEIVTNAKKRAEGRSTLNYGGQNPDSALTVVYLDRDHLKVTLQAKFLFDENTACLKNSAMDVLNRLSDLIQTKEGSRVEIEMVDELDVTGKSKDIDAERTLLVFALLNFKRLSLPPS